MKINELLEDQYGNQYFRVEKPFKVWALTGYTPSNHHFGSARLHEPKYKELELERDDELHWLVGGKFAIEMFDEGAGEVHEIRLTPPADFSPFEKNYGGGEDPFKRAIKKLLDDKKLSHLAKDAAAKVQYRK